MRESVFCCKKGRHERVAVGREVPASGHEVGHHLVNERSVIVRWQRDIHFEAVCVAVTWVSPPSSLFLVVATALWMLSLRKESSMDTEKGLNFIFRCTLNRTEAVLWGTKMIYELKSFKKGINLYSEVTIWNITPKGLRGNPEHGLEFALGVKWSLKLILFSFNTAKTPLLTSGMHFKKSNSNIRWKMLRNKWMVLQC